MPWFWRKRDEEAPDVGPPVAAEAPSEDDGVARSDAPAAGDWMAMPPMPRAVKPMPPSFHVQTISEFAPSYKSFRVSGSLGHSVSPDAPIGAVQGLATAV